MSLPQLLSQLLGTYGIQQGSVSPYVLASLGQQYANKDEMLSTLQNYGQGESGRLNQAFTDKSNALLARSSGLGLDLTSAYRSEGMGLEREKQLAQGGLNDQLLGHKLDILAGHNQNLLGLLGGAAQAGYQSEALASQNKLANRQLNQQWSMFEMDPRMQSFLTAITEAKQSGAPTAGGGAISGSGLVGNLAYLGIH